MVARGPSDRSCAELQVSFVLLLRLCGAHRCAAGSCLVRTAESIVSALVDRVG